MNGHQKRFFMITDPQDEREDDRSDEELSANDARNSDALIDHLNRHEEGEHSGSYQNDY